MDSSVCYCCVAFCQISTAILAMSGFAAYTENRAQLWTFSTRVESGKFRTREMIFVKETKEVVLGIVSQCNP